MKKISEIRFNVRREEIHLSKTFDIVKKFLNENIINEEDDVKTNKPFKGEINEENFEIEPVFSTNLIMKVKGELGDHDDKECYINVEYNLTTMVLIIPLLFFIILTTGIFFNNIILIIIPFISFLGLIFHFNGIIDKCDNIFDSINTYGEVRIDEDQED